MWSVLSYGVLHKFCVHIEFVNLCSSYIILVISFFTTKKKRENISWDKCIFCQCVSLEQRVNMRDVGKSSFVEAMTTRKDSVLRKWFKNWLASKTYMLPMWILCIIHLVFDLIRVNEIVECLKLSIIWRIQLNILMANNMKIKFKFARYYQLSLWILTRVSYVKKDI